MTATERRTPAHDDVGALEEERDFLLRSLDDLEREHDAGDVDDTDYLTLRDDYTARAAAVIRAIEASQAPERPERPPRRRGRRAAWALAVLVFAVVAGLLVAQMSGARRASDTATGSTTDDTRTLLADATNAFRQGKSSDAIALYTKALDLAPSNTEALAYRGWAEFQSGDADAAARDLDAAIGIDPAYADARVFRTAVYVEAGDFTDAATQLAAFDALHPPAMMQTIVDNQLLRQRIVAGVLLAPGAPSIQAAGYTNDQVVDAAAATAESLQKPSDAIRLLDLVLAADPDDAEAHAYKGWTLARVGVQAKDSSVTATGLREIEAALALQPQLPDALVYKAFTLYYGMNDTAGAKAALAAFDALADKPQDLVTLIDQNQLRAALGE